MDFEIFDGLLIANERNRKDRQILGPSQGTEKTIEGQGNTNCSWCAQNGHRKHREWTRDIGNLWENRKQPDNRIEEMG